MINKRQYIILSFFLTRVLFLGGGISLLIGISNNTLILTSVLGMFLGYFLLYLFYKKGSINKWMEVLISIFSLIIIWLIDTTLTGTYLLYNTPTLFILSVLVILSLYGTTKEFKIIGRVSEIFIVFTFIILLVMLITLPPLVKIDNLLPFFVTKFSNFIKGIIVFTGASLMPNLLLLRFKDKLKFKDISIGYIVGSLSIILVMFIILSIYGGNFASILRFPEYLILKKINILDYISNVENILIIEWIINIIIGSLLCVKILKDNLNIYVFVIIIALLFGLIEFLLTKNYIYVLYVKKYSYYIFFATVILSYLCPSKKK